LFNIFKASCKYRQFLIDGTWKVRSHTCINWAKQQIWHIPSSAHIQHLG
jgi:hypothetical protein